VLASACAENGRGATLAAMFLAVTALDVAFVSALAALAAPVTSVAVARVNRHHERQLAREERGFEARTLAFEETLTELGADLIYARHRVQEIRAGRAKFESPRDPSDNPTEHATEWSRSGARIASLATEAIMTVFERNADAQGRVLAKARRHSRRWDGRRDGGRNDRPRRCRRAPAAA